jgi:signal transduction histidine kinase
MHKIKSLLNFFIPVSAHRSVVQLRKATILSFSHFYLIIALFILLLTSSTLYNILLFPTCIIVPLIIFALFFFKNKGNINLSGNILTAIWLVPMMMVLTKTGGNYSSFMPLLYTVTLVMVLVESYIWATFWFFMASGISISFYFIGHYNPSFNINQCTDFDMLVGYLAAGCFLFSSLIVFERHQVFVIKLLKSKHVELKEQKQKVAQQVIELEEISNKLTTSNNELMVFAYAASHDLKEPLRMINMYVQLLNKKISPTLDNNSKEYIHFVVDGVKRMQQLLDNLLAYSLLGQKRNDVEIIDMNTILSNVEQNLTVLINETQAQISYSELPTINASKTEMIQLFQNIMANALKFRKKDVRPVIQISYTDNSDEYHFAIADNGIGISQKDKEKVFELFTRLNHRSAYEGTGIGLATCKKILKNLNGRIWLTSTEGVGTTFYFTFPKTGFDLVPKPVDLEEVIY